MNSTYSCIRGIRDTRPMLARRLSPVGQSSTANGGASDRASLAKIRMDIADEASLSPESVLRALLDEAHAQLRETRRALEAMKAQVVSLSHEARFGTVKIEE